MTACTFAGAGSTELWITTSRQGVDPAREPAAGALFSVSVGARGVTQTAFAG